MARIPRIRAPMRLRACGAGMGSRAGTPVSICPVRPSAGCPGAPRAHARSVGAAGIALVPALVLALALAPACSTAPADATLNYRVDPATSLNERLWPAPPEVPRYRYVGDLVGQQNVRSDEDETGGNAFSRGLASFWSWLTGLDSAASRRNELQRPQAGATDPQGRVYVTDVSRQAVFVFDVVRGELRLWEFADGRRFVSPVGVALDGAARVLVTDAALGAVYRFRPDGTFLDSFGAGLLQRPTGIAIDPERQHVYVADTDADDVKIFDGDGNLLDTVGYTGDGAGRLNRPVYLAFARDRLYVSDALNARVQIFDRDGNAVASVGQRGLYVGNLTRPKGVAVDSEGHLYVVEGFYDHLLVYDRDGRFLMSIGGTGQQPGRFYLPAGAWVDQDDRIYVADMFNGRVSVYQFLGAEQ